jgi:anthranilate phosphoribosyltransferase
MPADLNQTLDVILCGEDLDEAAAADLMESLTDEDLSPVLSGALLVALRAKGETADELRGFARRMRALARPVPLPDGLAAADCVGTGGDGSGSYNLSTGSALLAAACGVPMIKHGNRSVSSRSGSADVLETLGVPLAPDPETALSCLEQIGFAFLFAPFFHPAMKAIAPVRAALKVRTLFNVLGPLTNPAAPPYLVIGAFDLKHARLMADGLAGLDIQRAFVVHGEPGWDEATPVGPFTLYDVRPGEVTEQHRDPADHGLPRCTPDALAGGDARANADALKSVFDGRDTGAHRDALLLGAGLVLEVAGATPDLDAGIARARDALEQGLATTLLDRLRAFRGG